ncbi:peptidoglycan-binding protein [Burkholderia pseudomultivorans]|uniref:N-acetylmuramidase domain-containing protein n=1 Tax=Burkholderia pseudomultivorans TaxID=1207504 RepID=UPI0007548509|nr:N-acetylmuramidase family protein [Burkholderia pseudomultivorans]KVC43646.1 peptidoglycan-binding protein [Burkholderia pseudomultivorans]
MNTLRFNSRGAEVGVLQQRLVRAGYPIDVTHLYDEATEQAVKALQAAAGIVVDGIAGPNTYAVLSAGQRDRKHLTEADIVRASDKLGVSPACVRAVNEVESRGSGFLADGRPVILFERHVMYNRLVAAKRAVDAASAAQRFPNVVSAKPGGYQGGAAEYVRLDTAARIDAAIAYESASWGAFQVMGYHWERLGYSSIDEFVARMETSEGEQLDAFVRFVASDSSLRTALKNRKWAAFAKGYNGADYARNLYDAKLAQAYERYAGTKAAA